MKYLLVLILIFGLTALCYANRVCLEKTTGKLIEYQSGSINDPISRELVEAIAKKEFDKLTEGEKRKAEETIKQNRLNSLKQNAINAGYLENNIEVKEITKEEWKTIEYTQLIKPAQDKAKQEALAKKQKQDAIKTKIKTAVPTLTDEDLEELLND